MGVGTPANILEGVERGIDFLTAYTPAETDGTDMFIPQRQAESVQPEIRAGSPLHRGRLPVSGLPSLQQGVHPPSAEGERDAGYAALCSAQPVFLQQYDGRNPHRSGGRPFCGVQAGETGWHDGILRPLKIASRWAGCLQEPYFHTVCTGNAQT